MTHLFRTRSKAESNPKQSYHEGHGEIYKNYGIDPTIGAAVILRPDQYVSWVGDFDDFAAMQRFFGGFMLVQSQEKVTGGISTQTTAKQDSSQQTASEALPEKSGFVAVEQETPVVNGAL